MCPSPARVRCIYYHFLRTSRNSTFSLPALSTTHRRPVTDLRTVTLWTPQCRSACEDANLACNPVFLASGQAPQDCTQNVPGSPLPLFPDGDLVVPLAPGLNASAPCQAQAPFVCPTTKDGVTLKRVPLDRRNETNGFSCWDCPVPVFASRTLPLASPHATLPLDTVCLTAFSDPVQDPVVGHRHPRWSGNVCSFSNMF